MDKWIILIFIAFWGGVLLSLYSLSSLPFSVGVMISSIIYCILVSKDAKRPYEKTITIQAEEIENLTKSNEDIANQRDEKDAEIERLIQTAEKEKNSLKEENQDLQKQVDKLTQTLNAKQVKLTDKQLSKIDQRKQELNNLINTPCVQEYLNTEALCTKIKRNNPYFDSNLRRKYAEAFRTQRLERALEHLVAPEKVTITATMKSFSSSKKYSTTLIECTCDDFKCRQKPCKHMLSLAIFYNATYYMNDEIKAVLNNAVKEREATQKLKKEIDAKEKQRQKQEKQ